MTGEESRMTFFNGNERDRMWIRRDYEQESRKKILKHPSLEKTDV